MTPSALRLRLPAPLGILAGASSLAFEVLWARQLTIEAGGPMAAFTIVICAFMLGLAMGAAWLGRAADRCRTPLRLFGLVQLSAGLAILAAAAAAAAGGAVRPLLVELELPAGGAGFLLVEVILGGGIAFVVAFAMGGTVPLLLAASSHAAGSQAARIGKLAALNAAGAAAGALACGFWLLPALGLARSLVATATLSLAVGAAAALAARPRGQPSPIVAGTPQPGARGVDTPPARTSPSPGAVLAALLGMGMAVTALEVVWTRLAILTFGSSVQAASLVLAAVIAGLSVGNACGGRMSRRPDPGGGRLGMIACLGALAILATAPVLGRLPLIAAQLGGYLANAGDTQAEALAMHASRFVLMFALVVAPCLLLGASFPIGCSLLPASWSAGRVVGLASAATSLGNLLGAPAAYFGIMSLAGSRGCLLASAGAVTLAGAAVTGTGQGAWARRALVLAALALTGLSGRFQVWDPAILSSGPFLYGALYQGAGLVAGQEELLDRLRRRGEIVFSREGHDALVTVRRLAGGTLSMQVNGKTDASTGGDMKTQMLTAHLPLLLDGRPPDTPRNVLVIGLGSGVTVAAALSHPVRRIEVVEISAEVAQASRLFGIAQRGALDDPRVKLTIGDARTRLLAPAPAASELFDIIASQPSNPWVAGQALLFTREFYLSARRHLARSGTMCQWIQGYGLAPEDFRSVVATFASVFPHVSMWEESTAGGDYLLLGSDFPLGVDGASLRRRMSRSPVGSDLALVEIDGPAELLSHYVASVEARRGYLEGAVIQTEDRLSLEFNAPSALHRDTLGSILKSLEPWRADPARLVPGDPELGDQVARRNRAARKEREWAAGLGLMDASRSLDPEMMRAISYLRAGMRSHALEVLVEISRRRPSDRTPRLILGYLLLSSNETGAIASAIDHLQAAVELDPDDPRARIYLARALYSAGRLPQAIAENLRAESLDPSVAETSSDRCALLLADGDIPSAEAACLKAVALDPTLAEAHANLGVTQARRGRLEAAEASYRRALRLDPGLTDARYNLAALLERQAGTRDALEVLAPVLSGTGPTDAATWRLAARLAIAASDLKAARRYLDRSLSLEPENEESKELERMLR